MVGSHKVVDKDYVHTKNSCLISIGAIFTTIYKGILMRMASRQLNLWPNHHPVVWGITVSCLLIKMEPFEDHLSACGHLASLRNKPQQSILGNFQHHYLSELLVNVYSYCLIVKSVSCRCVRRSQLFSDPITYY